MNQIKLTQDEILYLESLLRHMQGTGGPISLDLNGEDLAQSILDKLEQIGYAEEV